MSHHFPPVNIFLIYNSKIKTSVDQFKKQASPLALELTFDILQQDIDPRFIRGECLLKLLLRLKLYGFGEMMCCVYDIAGHATAAGGVWRMGRRRKAPIAVI